MTCSGAVWETVGSASWRTQQPGEWPRETRRWPLTFGATASEALPSQARGRSRDCDQRVSLLSQGRCLVAGAEPTWLSGLRFTRKRGCAVARSRWRLVAVGATVVVSAATGVLTNLVTNKWSVALGVTLGALVVIGVLLQVVLAGRGDLSGSGSGQTGRRWSGIRQRARASGRSMIIQSGRDVSLRAEGGNRPGGDGQDPET
jgi:hypothetical protein